MKHKTSPISEQQHEPQQASVTQDHSKQSNCKTHHPMIELYKQAPTCKQFLKMRGGRSVGYFE